MDAQLRELLTNYGEIAGIWFDGMWDKPDADWRLAKTYKLIHDLQPQALVGSNHHCAPYPGEDFQMFEKDLPGQNASGFSKGEVVSNQLPLETCETMNKAWGFNIGDAQYKSTHQLIQYLVKAAGHNANFLLNIGPMPNGKIQPEFQTRLREMGQWLARYGESIYGTRGGPITPRPWGVTTQKANKVYVHILDWQDASLALPSLAGKVKSVHFLKDGSRGEVTETGGGLVLTIPSSARDDLDTIAVLELEER